MPQCRSIETELGLHGTDRLLVLLDDRADDLLVLAHTGDSPSSGRTMVLAMLLPQPIQLLVPRHILLPQLLVVVLDLIEVGESLLQSLAGSFRVTGARADGDRSPIFDRLHLLPQPRHHALQPLDVIPTFLLLIDDRPILDVPRAIRIL